MVRPIGMIGISTGKRQSIEMNAAQLSGNASYFAHHSRLLRAHQTDYGSCAAACVAGQHKGVKAKGRSLSRSN